MAALRWEDLMPQLTKVRMINPFGKKRKKSRKNRGARKARRRASPKFVLLGGNPERSNMAKSRKKKKAKRPGKHYSRAKRGFFAKKRNPFFGKKRRHHHRRNPWVPGTSKEVIELSGGALAGGLGARLIPENVPMISTYNSGIVGYGLNLLAGYVTAKVAGYLFNSTVEKGALAGAVLMTGSRFVSDRFGKTIISFGATRLGYDPAFNFRRFGKYVSAADQALPPLPVPTAYPASGPVPPLPVGTSLRSLPAAAAGKVISAPTVAAASSMGAYGRNKYGVNRFM